MGKKIKMNNKNKLTLKEGWDKFKRHCKIKNLADDTIDHYKAGYKYLKKYLDEEFLLEDIDSDTIENFIEYLKLNFEMRDSSINSRLRAVRRYIYYFVEKGYINNFKISLLKVQKKQKKPYSDEELKKLLNKPDLETCNFAEYRNWVIINFLLGTGVRLATLVNILLEDISLNESLVDLRHTKNKGQQIIPISKSLNEILQEYISIREGEPEEFLFCNIYGNKLKRDSVKTAIYRYNKRRDIDKTSIHLFRHTFAKKWIMAGGDPFRLQKILGHKSIRIVKEYINLYSQDLKQNFDRFNPLENLNTSGDYIKIED